VSRADVVRSDGPDRGFEEAAAEAAKQWRYEPARIDDRVVEFCVEVLIEFELPGGDRDPSGAGS
jgi:outer membrane biosynthesis protein TonB